MDMKAAGAIRVNVKPYHETIVGAIERCCRGACPESSEFRRLFIFIKETAIPKGHEDAVLVALRTHFHCDECENGGECKAERQAAEESIIAQKAMVALRV
jgi:hypothetical protein